ncbi:MAG: PAS domain S-box protein [Deltaproteobacteria bacterium]|nr:PAS domain S-box protein [Deltaproteobacteria bacterium]
MNARQQYAELFDSSGIPMCLSDRTGVIIDRNGPFDNLFGAGPGAVAPQNIADLCDPDFRDTFAHVLSVAGEGHAGAPYPFQFWYAGKRGGRRKADVNITRLPGKETFLLTFQDVTDKVDAFEELNRRNRDLVGLVKITKLISSTLDNDKIVRVALDEAVRLFDLDRGWLLTLDPDGRALSTAAAQGAPPLDPSALAAMGRFFLRETTDRFKPAIIESGRGLHLSSTEADLMAALGARLLVMTPMIVGGALRGMMCLAAAEGARSFTQDRVSLLQTLTHQLGVALENARLFLEAENNRQRFWLLAENMKDVVFILDRNLQIIYVNEAVRENVGYDKKDLIGHNATEFVTEGPVNDAAIEQFIALVSGADIPPLAYDLARPGGTHATLEVSLSKMSDRGELIGFQGVVRNITQKLTWEREMRRHADQQTMLLKLSRILTASPDLGKVPGGNDPGLWPSSTPSQASDRGLTRTLRDSVELICGFLGVESVAIYTYDEERHEFVHAASHIMPAARDATHLEPPAWFPAPQGTVGLLANQGPIVFADVPGADPGFPATPHMQRLGMRSNIITPIVYGDRLLGFLGAATHTFRRDFSTSETNLLSAVTGQLSIALMNARHFDELARHRSDLERLSNRLFTAQEEERRRIARELHDEAGQSLYALKLSLELMKEKSSPTASEGAAMLEDQIRVVSQAIENIRRITYDLRPTLLDDLGLIPAIRWYIDGFEKRTAIKVDLAVNMPEHKLDSLLEVNVYRILQEALTNVRRHAAAGNVSVRLFAQNRCLRLEIQDDGHGFSAAERATASGGVGLIGMKERIVSLGGSLLIDSLRGRGTNLSVEIPLRGAN